MGVKGKISISTTSNIRIWNTKHTSVDIQQSIWWIKKKKQPGVSGNRMNCEVKLTGHKQNANVVLTCPAMTPCRPLFSLTVFYMEVIWEGGGGGWQSVHIDMETEWSAAPTEKQKKITEGCLFG